MHAKHDTKLFRMAQLKPHQNLSRIPAAIYEIELRHARAERLKLNMTKLLSGLAFMAMLSRLLSLRPTGKAMLGPPRRSHTTEI